LKIILTRVFALAACALALIAISAASAGASGEAEDSQLLDVSKQVEGIQQKMDDLLAHGRRARAGKLLASADCGYDESSKVFAPWGDSADYSLAPQGDLAVTTGWTLNKQAKVVVGGDPFSGADQSLSLVNGGQGATPAMCVNLDNPTFRFFTRDVGGNGKANLKLDLLYEDVDGHVKHLTIAKVKASGDWQPSVIVPIYTNVLSLASATGVTAVAFQFKAEGLQKDETLSISSIYVDPYVSR
jgi:hypothetical protein